MTRRIRRVVGALGAGMLTLTGMVVSGEPAAASHIQCGAVITQSISLDGDLGPCPGNGLVVRGNNITIDLRGHRIFAANGPEETAGIRLGMVNGVTVRNGTVEGFDAGIAIFGGSGNTVRNITAQNNRNDLLEPFPFTPGEALPPEQHPLMLCDFGDGIMTFASDNNRIESNRVIDNGPYSGISLVDDSDNNLVRNNQVVDNNSTNVRPDGEAGLCGATLPGAPGMQRGRDVQNIGIRIEGPNANDNRVERNAVSNSALVGISVHSYVCNPAPGEPRVDQEPNTRNTIEGNVVRDTGAETVHLDEFADGIASLSQGPIGRITCPSRDNTFTRNVSMNNRRHGVALHTLTEGNVVSGNVTRGNGQDGVYVADRAVNNTITRNIGRQNAEHDGHEGNPSCAPNNWDNNMFATVMRGCERG